MTVDDVHVYHDIAKNKTQKPPQSTSCTHEGEVLAHVFLLLPTVVADPDVDGVVGVEQEDVVGDEILLRELDDLVDGEARQVGALVEPRRSLVLLHLPPHARARMRNTHTVIIDLIVHLMCVYIRT